jgi:type IV secretion system protein VirB6
LVDFSGVGKVNIRFFIIFCLLIASPTSVWAGILDGCYMSWELSDTVKTQVDVKAVGDGCDKLCFEQCSKTFSVSGEGGKSSHDWGEINQDVIDICQIDCRNGLVKQYEYRTSAFDFQNYNNKATASITSACPTASNDVNSANFVAYDTNQNVNVGDVITLRVIGNQFEGGVTYLCGATTSYLLPNPWSLSLADNVWNNSSQSSSPQNWHARNANFTDVGIDVRNGDYLSITFGHSFGSYCDTSLGQCNIPSTNCSQKFNWSKNGLQVRQPSTQSWGPNNQMMADMPEGNLLCFDNVNADENSITNVIENNKNISWYGLGGRRWTGENAADNGGKYNMYEFAGNLAGFSNNTTPFGVRHADDVPTTNWADNNGGYMAKITVKRCRFRNGERLQYAIIDKNVDMQNTVPNSWNWQNVNNLDTSLGLASINAASEGRLYLRIRPLAANEVDVVTCNNANQECINSRNRVNSAHGASRALGYYKVLVQKEPKEQSFISIAQKVEEIQEYLLGGGNNIGLVGNIFNRLVGKSSLLNAISALLALYIAFTGIAFMSGMSPITQREGMNRLIKVGVIAVLVNPNSWQFFNEYLFSLMIKGSVELMAIFSSTESGVPISSIGVFLAEALEEPWGVFSSNAFRAKMAALSISGYFGILVALFVCVAMLVYIYSMIKVVIIYVISLVMLSFLFILSPIYLCFLLFKYTKGMFDTWVKMMISYALQPVMIFAAISLMMPVLKSLMYATLGFTVCPACFLEVPVVGCLIPGWKTLYYGTVGASAAEAMPIQQLVVVFAFLVMTFITYSICLYTAEIASLISTGRYVGVKLDDVASSGGIPMTVDKIGSPISYARNAPQNIAAGYTRTRRLFGYQ